MHNIQALVLPFQVLPTAALATVLATLLCLPLHAANAQERMALGPVYAIKENDFLKVIEARMLAKQKSGELAKIEREAIARSKQSIELPKSLGVLRTQTPRTHYFDPSIRANEELRTPDGKTVVAKGTVVNPLNVVAMSKVMLFFDASDAEQLAYATRYMAKQTMPVKAVLTGGSYMALMRQWKFPVYFDQGASLVTKLGIRQVPAIVYQEGKQLRIDEVKP
jgi:conjugal transfer pilus assembly protein TraW